MKKLEEMSDEELLAMNPPGEEEEEQVKEEENEASEPVNEPEEQEEPAEETTEEVGEESSEEVEEESKEEEKPEDSGSEEEKDNREEDKEPAPSIDYKKFYEAMMGPIKANGKTFQPRTPEEAIRMMQMGANYTQKMQGMAPYRKKIQMLQNAGLLEDEKLNYLIDLSKGNPEAVKKLLKDSKLDPLDLNISEESTYTPGNHTVSDAEVQVQTIVDDLKSTPEGLETLRLVQGWDQASLNEVWQTPSILTTLNEQRQNGVYKIITDEMEHQRMLGNIPEGTSFLDAYKAVGDYCLKKQQYLAQQQMAANLPKGTVKKAAPTSTRVKSAAPSGRSKATTSKFVDPFSLSDEEFEKEFNNYSI